MMSAPRRVVVTGGAGFIGSTLTDRLLSKGWADTAINGFDPFYPRAVKETNIERAQKNPRSGSRRWNTGPDALLATVEHARPEVIVDLAARAGVRPRSPTLALTSTSTSRVPRPRWRRAGRRCTSRVRVFQFGLRADPRRPFCEEQMAARPLSPYRATKVAGEALAHAHHAITGLPVGSRACSRLRPAPAARLGDPLIC